MLQFLDSIHFHFRDENYDRLVRMRLVKWQRAVDAADTACGPRHESSHEEWYWKTYSSNAHQILTEKLIKDWFFRNGGAHSKPSWYTHQSNDEAIYHRACNGEAHWNQSAYQVNSATILATIDACWKNCASYGKLTLIRIHHFPIRDVFSCDRTISRDAQL